MTSIEAKIMGEFVQDLGKNELLAPELIASIQAELSIERGPNPETLAELFRSGQEIK